MQAKLQKLSANKDNMDSIQFQLNEAQAEAAKNDLLELRRYDNVEVRCISNQSQISEEGTLNFPSLNFQAKNTSMSICVMETGWIVTITLSFEDQKVFPHIINNQIRNQVVELEFFRGDNPYS